MERPFEFSRLALHRNIDLLQIADCHKNGWIDISLAQKF
jgi:hypothetical protein